MEVVSASESIPNLLQSQECFFPAILEPLKDQYHLYFEYDLLWNDFGKLRFALFTFFIESLVLNMRQRKNSSIT